jgi:hypothetical protein
MTMRLCQQIFAIAFIFLATPSIAEPFHGSRLLQHVQNSRQDAATVFVSNETKQEEPDTDILALMSGKCSTLKVAGRDFACRAVAFFHGEQGRANFTIALDDPTDDTHIITFSGQNSRREQDNLYELQIDRMLGRLANERTEDKAILTADGKASCQAKRTARMPSQGRSCEDPAKGPDGLHDWMPRSG